MNWIAPDRRTRILALALPIIGGMVSQNVLNLVDTAMVGVLGNAALAAVGLGGFALFMSQALILGLSTGVQATVARRKGEGRLNETAVFLNAALLIVLIFGPLFSALLYGLVPLFYPYLNGDPDVIRQGVPYLQVRILATVFVGMNFSFRGYWNAIDMSRLYMSTLIVMHASNIFLNWVFIFGNLGAPELGVTGAGLASALSTVIGSATYFWLGSRHARVNGFLKRKPRRREIASVVRLSLPNGIQQLFFAAGFTVLFWIVGQVGTKQLAAATVLINVTLVAILPGLGLGLAAATLVGQALGRGDPDDAYRWGWDVAKFAVVILGLLGVPMWLVPDLMLSAFIHDPETMDLARWPIRLVGLTMAIEAVGLVLMHALLGAGDSKRVMLVAVSAQWIVFLPIAYLVGPALGFGLLGIWILQGTYRTLQAGLFRKLWEQRDWARIRV